MIATGPDLAAYWARLLTPAAVGTVFEQKVWRGSLAPQSSPPPNLLYFLLTGADDRCLDGGSWAGAEATYFVKGVGPRAQYGQGFAAGLGQVMAALEAAMLTDTVLAGYRYSLLASGDWREYEEALDGGQVLIHSGRAWTVAVDPR